MSGKDERSKVKGRASPEKLKKLAQTVALRGDKTQPLSPEEADKARARVREAVTRAAVERPPATASASVPPARAGSPRSPFAPFARRDAKTEVFGAEEVRKAREKVEEARAKANPPAGAKTSVLSPEEAKRARALLKAKMGEPPSKITGKPPAGIGALKETLPMAGRPRHKGMREPASKPPRKAPAGIAALGRTLPMAGKPARPAGMTQRPAAAESPPVIPTIPVPNPDAGVWAAREAPGAHDAYESRDARAPHERAPEARAPRGVSPAAILAPGEALFRGAKLRGARLVRADLRGADLREADLSESDLAHADLSLARLDDATLSHANLYNTKLEGADMVGCTRVGTRKINPDRS